VVLQGFQEKARVEGIAMAKHCRKMGCSFSRCAGPRSFFSSATREFQQGGHIRRSLRVVGNLTRARIGPPPQHVDHFLVQGSPPCRRNRGFERAAGELVPELHYSSFEGKHALLHALVQTGVDRPLYQVRDDRGFCMAGKYGYRVEHGPSRVRQARRACKRRIAHRVGGHITVQRQRFGH